MSPGGRKRVQAWTRRSFLQSALAALPFGGTHRAGAAVRDDARMVKLAIAGGNSPKNVTSPYQGTALIAAAHLGHVEPVRTLIEAGAPLDHVNNLGWTALMEAVVLGDGGADYRRVVRLLVEAGADTSIADRDGVTPLAHARARGYMEIAKLLEKTR